MQESEYRVGMDTHDMCIHLIQMGPHRKLGFLFNLYFKCIYLHSVQKTI